MLQSGYTSHQFTGQSAQDIVEFSLCGWMVKGEAVGELFGLEVRCGRLVWRIGLVEESGIELCRGLLESLGEGLRKSGRVGIKGL